MSTEGNNCKQLGWRSVAVRINDPENLGDVSCRSYRPSDLPTAAELGYGERTLATRTVDWSLGMYGGVSRIGEWEEPDDAG